MRDLARNPLPEPEPDLGSWPWGSEMPDLPGTMPGGGAWPKISIVTPTLNQDRFIEATVRSVLLQGYPNLEYIVIDGGSGDRTLAILEKYRAWIDVLVSEPDRGQSHALNKGFALSTGKILGWLNSDDLYCAGSLARVAATFAQQDCDILSGNTVYLDGERIGERKAPALRPVPELLRTYLSPAPQPSTFWKRDCWAQFGPLDESLHYRMDYALFLCFAASDYRWCVSEDDLAVFRRHAAQKTWSWRASGIHAEKAAAVGRFSQFEDFAARYAADIRRALLYEGWLASWIAQNDPADGEAGRLGRLLSAPFHNWRCLVTPSYYRQVGKTLWRLLSR